MYNKLFSKFDEVHRVTTVEEKEALYRQRYKLYFEELKFDIPDVDHKNKMLKDELDESPNAIHLYTGTPDNMLGSIRLLVWPPGEVDKGFFSLYSLQNFPHIQELRCAEAGRLMILPSSRGNLTFPSLVCKAYEILVNECNIDIMLSRCRPGLIPHYRKLGFRPYKAPLLDSPLGVTPPLICIPSDLDYQKSVASIVLPICENAFTKGKRHRLNIQDFEPILAEDNQLISYKTEQLWSSVEKTLAQTELSQGLFYQLSESDKKLILDGGIKMEVEEGTDVTLQGKMETELYFVLKGSFNVVVNNKVITQIGEGEVFGEMAFFREDSLRTATVKAAERGEVLVLSRKFIDKIEKESPSASSQILFNLGRILANRLAALTNCW